ncbi:metallo-peptidase, Clan MA(E), Family M1 [Leishmania mexicana MHOM/GT/2001/U1103]|uniref:Puromycin-sensitive aminopeptidase-like protein n=1 Tax=Leishmania mexicana (strain MHOM/GT/2001/U1103) TaxID=929439 RepID=E9AP25_LEIMU|nr:metallo-peptidase, Clan MA(E), Family M1 [Leishmania mexicana MHOM/GT/2001/U1103]CBZ24689.1 metallo-peptidase, Clan MA(E), Family M1 [Leishmania mexicana MHOM/GT/2001/U1103]
MVGMPSSISLPPVPEAVLEGLQSPEFRMPSLVLPQHYALEFQPDAQHHSFAGSVYITMRVLEAPSVPIRHLVLHALYLRLEASSIRVFVPADPSSAFEAAALQTHPSHHLGDEASRQRPFSIENGSYVACQGLHKIDISETVLLAFAAHLPSEVGDTFVLIIDRFDGVIATPPEMEGLFHSNSTDASVLSTHLEPTGARRLYPCFDEPAIQATFQLSVIATVAQTVLSNTEVEADIAVAALPYTAQKRQGTSEDASNRRSEAQESSSCASPSLPQSAPSWHCVRFEPTPLLHTCIVGFHVGRFTFLEQYSRSSGVLCRVVLPHTEASSSGCFALDLATKAVDFFADFFHVPLPLKKLDVVGVETFCVLGMENWGMVNLLQDYLIVTETTPLERRQRVTRLIGHEICHQWFGDWVSIEWWNGLWLKEGMCRYLEYFFVNAVFPGWGLWNEFLCNIMNGALLADADPRETHPVDCCNSSPRRIYDSFDAISYGKGACVLRMLFSIIGVEWLKRATHLLMVRFAGRAINAKDLVECIVDTNKECCSGEAQLQHVKALHACLRMVETVSHPYLYICQRPGESYTITQYVPPSKRHGLLVAYLQQQRRKSDAPVIDLFSAPVGASFEWTPESTLSRVTASFSIPLRTVEWTPSGCANASLIFLEEAEHQFACPTSASTLKTRRDTPLTPLGAAPGHAGAETGAVQGSAVSPTPQQTPLSSPPFGAPGCTRYFNQGGGGFFQCDYDAATWRRLFELVAFFSEEDRVIVTMHFINFSKAQLGHQPGDTGDRCTLFFEWLLRLTGTPGAMNSFLWELVTNALTTLVQLVQHCYCHSIVKEFVSTLYMPLERRRVLSFFAQEKTMSFQSSIHLSRQLVLRILQLLCLCDNPAVLKEAEETAQWSLGVLLSPGDSPAHTSSSISSSTCVATGNELGAGGVANLSIASVSASLGLPSGSGAGAGFPLSTTIPTAGNSGPLQSATSISVAGALPPRGKPAAPAALMSSGANWYSRGSVQLPLSPERLLSVSNTSISGHVASPVTRSVAPLSSTPATQRSSSSDMFAASYCNPAGGVAERSSEKSTSLHSYPDHRTSDFNIEDPSHIQAGSIALSHLITQGRLDYWVAAAAVAVELLRLDRDELRHVSGMPVPVPRMANVSQEQRRNVLRLVLPPVFALNQESAFPFMTRIFHAAPFLESSSAMGLYRNSRFFLYLLSSRRLMTDRRTLQFLLRYGAEVCGDGYIIAQLKLLAQGGPSAHSAACIRSVEQYRGVEFADSAQPMDSSSSTKLSANASSPLSSSSSVAVSERSALRGQCPAMAAALDCMESNCVWMDYCCSHYDQFLRAQLHPRVLQAVRNEGSAPVSLPTPLAKERCSHPESCGGVSVGPDGRRRQ